MAFSKHRCQQLMMSYEQKAIYFILSESRAPRNFMTAPKGPTITAISNMRTGSRNEYTLFNESHEMTIQLSELYLALKIIALVSIVQFVLSMLEQIFSFR